MKKMIPPARVAAGLLVTASASLIPAHPCLADPVEVEIVSAEVASGVTRQAEVVALEGRVHAVVSVKQPVGGATLHLRAECLGQTSVLAVTLEDPAPTAIPGGRATGEVEVDLGWDGRTAQGEAAPEDDYACSIVAILTRESPRGASRRFESAPLALEETWPVDDQLVRQAITVSPEGEVVTGGGPLIIEAPAGDDQALKVEIAEGTRLNGAWEGDSPIFALDRLAPYQIPMGDERLFAAGGVYRLSPEGVRFDEDHLALIQIPIGLSDGEAPEGVQLRTWVEDPQRAAGGRWAVCGAADDGGACDGGAQLSADGRHLVARVRHFSLWVPTLPGSDYPPYRLTVTTPDGAPIPGEGIEQVAAADPDEALALRLTVSEGLRCENPEDPTDCPIYEPRGAAGWKVDADWSRSGETWWPISEPGIDTGSLQISEVSSVKIEPDPESVYYVYDAEVSGLDVPGVRWLAYLVPVATVQPGAEYRLFSEAGGCPASSPRSFSECVKVTILPLVDFTQSLEEYNRQQKDYDTLVDVRSAAFTRSDGAVNLRGYSSNVSSRARIFNTFQDCRDEVGEVRAVEIDYGDITADWAIANLGSEDTEFPHFQRYEMSHGDLTVSSRCVPVVAPQEDPIEQPERCDGVNNDGKGLIDDAITDLSDATIVCAEGCKYASINEALDQGTANIILSGGEYAEATLVDGRDVNICVLPGEDVVLRPPGAPTSGGILTVTGGGSLSIHGPGAGLGSLILNGAAEESGCWADGSEGNGLVCYGQGDPEAGIVGIDVQGAHLSAGGLGIVHMMPSNSGGQIAAKSAGIRAVGGDLEGCGGPCRVEVRDVYLEDYHKAGVVADGAAIDLTLTDVRLTGRAVSPIGCVVQTAQTGVAVRGDASATIQSAIITGHRLGIAGAPANGIFVHHTSGAVEVIDSLLLNNDIGARVEYTEDVRFSGEASRYADNRWGILGYCDQSVTIDHGVLEANGGVYDEEDARTTVGIDLERVDPSRSCGLSDRSWQISSSGFGGLDYGIIVGLGVDEDPVDASNTFGTNGQDVDYESAEGARLRASRAGAGWPDLPPEGEPYAP